MVARAGSVGLLSLAGFVGQCGAFYRSCWAVSSRLLVGSQWHLQQSQEGVCGVSAAPAAQKTGSQGT